MPFGHLEEILAVVKRLDEVQAWHLGSTEPSLHLFTSQPIFAGWY
jgi:hypothetical protein